MGPIMGMPLVLPVGLAEDEVFATWRAKAGTIVLALMALCAVAGALWLRLAWQSRRTARAERMLSRSADAALYDAKRSGRDRMAEAA